MTTKRTRELERELAFRALRTPGGAEILSAMNRHHAKRVNAAFAFGAFFGSILTGGLMLWILL